MRVRVLWIGKAGPYEEQVATYRKRVCRRWQAEDVILRPAAGGRSADPAKVLLNEAENLRQHLAERWLAVVLDERGKGLSSEDLAGRLEDAEMGAIPGINFVIGSDLGLDPGLKREAGLRLSLSAMTLPHQLARLLLWEQLFRATHILGGGGYHRP